MGNFLTSPREAASVSLYDMLQGGSTPFDAAIDKSTNQARSSLRAGVNTAVARSGSETASRLASEGYAGGAGVEDIIGREASRIREQGQRGETDLAAAGTQAKASLAGNLYNTAIGGLSPTSDLGNWLAGLETVTGIGTGVLTGLGPGGLGVLGRPLFEGLLGGNISGGKTPSTIERSKYGTPKLGKLNEPELYYGGGR